MCWQYVCFFSVCVLYIYICMYVYIYIYQRGTWICTTYVKSHIYFSIFTTYLLWKHANLTFHNIPVVERYFHNIPVVKSRPWCCEKSDKPAEMTCCENQIFYAQERKSQQVRKNHNRSGRNHNFSQHTCCEKCDCLKK